MGIGLIDEGLEGEGCALFCDLVVRVILDVIWYLVDDVEFIVFIDELLVRKEIEWDNAHLFRLPQVLNELFGLFLLQVIG